MTLPRAAWVLVVGALACGPGNPGRPDGGHPDQNRMSARPPLLMLDVGSGVARMADGEHRLSVTVGQLVTAPVSNEEGRLQTGTLPQAQIR